MGARLEAGTSIAHYRVVAALGAGGMGEVYKAHDNRLGRDVALKVLPSDAFRNDDRVRRFVQEAKAASSLNHPHIVTIHEIGEAPGANSTPVHYIAMELIDGTTLGSRIHDEKTGLKTLAGYLGQAADGLAKAHAAGIVHRDLKPDNIMISRDGYAKVLDFGLAKLTIGGDSGGATSAPTEPHTRDGIVMGTVGYMSPEQVEGKTVDHRSDIFSFGCILYEAATRRRPFTGDSDVDVMHKIVYDNPAPVEQLAPATPAVLRRLIRRCLAKNPDERVQSMKDIALELRDIAAEFDQLPMTSESKPVVVGEPQTRWPWIAGALLATMMVAGGVLMWDQRERPAPATAAPLRLNLDSMRTERVTNSGNVRGAAISPDGKYLAYVVREAGKGTLFVRQIATQSDLRIVGPADIRMWRVRYSPDGNYLYYMTIEGIAKVSYKTVYRVPSVGGTPVKVVYDEDTMPEFSPDGTKFAFARGVPERRQYDIVTANADGSGQHVVATGPLGSWTFVAPSWSPDGNRLITGVPDRDGVRLATVDLARGTKQPFGPKWFVVYDVHWLPDGSGLIISAQQSANERWQVWFQPYPSGAPRRMSNLLSEFLDVTMTADGKAICAIEATDSTSLVMAARGTSAERVLVPESQDEDMTNFSPARNGLVAFEVDRGTAREIRVLDPGSESPRALSTGGSAENPRVTADGSVILFNTTRGDGVLHVWRVDADGSNLRQLTHGAGERLVAIAPDASWYLHGAQPSIGLWKSTADGTVTKFCDECFSEAAVSPDGQWIAEMVPSKAGPRTLRVVSATGGETRLQIPFPDGDGLQWAGDSDAVAYFKPGSNNAYNIWLQPLSGGAPRTIMSFKDGIIGSYALLPDGRILLSRMRPNYNAVLITDFR